MKRDIPLGSAYLFAALLTISFIFRDAAIYSPSILYGLLWIGAYHLFWIFAVKAIRNLFPGFMLDGT